MYWRWIIEKESGQLQFGNMAKTLTEARSGGEARLFAVSAVRESLESRRSWMYIKQTVPQLGDFRTSCAEDFMRALSENSRPVAGKNGSPSPELTF